MRRAAKVDANQPEIVAGLRKLGCSVQVISFCGQGVPDILVGFGGNNYLFEIKNPDVPKSDQKLTVDETVWQVNWRGRVNVVFSVADAWKLMEKYDQL